MRAIVSALAVHCTALPRQNAMDCRRIVVQRFALRRCTAVSLDSAPLARTAAARGMCSFQIIAEALIALVICTVGASWWAGSFKRILAAPTLWARSGEPHCDGRATGQCGFQHAVSMNRRHNRSRLLLLLRCSRAAPFPVRCSRYDGVSSVEEFQIYSHRGKAFAQWNIHGDKAADKAGKRVRGEESKSD